VSTIPAIPENLAYSKTHEWVRVETASGKRLATVGLTAFALEALTDLVFVDLPPVGREVKAGEPLGEIESVKAVSDIYSPVDGRIAEVSPWVRDNLKDLAKDPYGQGWLVKIEFADDAPLKRLMDAAAYRKQCEEEMAE
jgi:glycine cleavage system H protein